MEEFLWGIATSAYQSEGGFNGAGQPQTNWAAAERRNDVVPVGMAADFWNRYLEDFERAEKMSLNAFRLGIEWSRVQPTYVDQPGPAPAFDEKALGRYARLVPERRRHGLQAIVSLHLFVAPASVATGPC